MSIGIDPEQFDNGAFPLSVTAAAGHKLIIKSLPWRVLRNGTVGGFAFEISVTLDGQIIFIGYGTALTANQASSGNLCQLTSSGEAAFPASANAGGIDNIVVDAGQTLTVAISGTNYSATVGSLSGYDEEI